VKNNAPSATSPAPDNSGIRSVPRRQRTWFLASLLPSFISASTIFIHRPSGFPILAGLSIPPALFVAIALWWITLCAWQLHRISRGHNLPHEIQHLWQWLALLCIVNIPLTALLWLLAQLGG